MKKDETLQAWRALPEGQNPLAHMRPIPYKTEGSRYGCDGIRIDGSAEFIDAVLSRLKPLLDGENVVTRLELARHEVKRQPGYKSGMNAATGAQVCYIRLHERGREGSMSLAFCNGKEARATERYAEVLGVEV